MTAARWRALERVLDEAAGLAAGERPAFLDRACAGDARLRAEVERLLDLDARAGAYFDRFAQTALRPRAERAAPAAPPRHPARIGGWRIVREVARGGMGVVFEGVRGAGRDAQRAAVKLVRPGLAPEFADRLRQEWRILASLDHPHIARLLDGGVLDDGRSYVVMEYVDGEPITRYAERRGLSKVERVVLFNTVCEAAAFVQRGAVVHCDLKPSNVLVTSEGHVKLLDFGIARLLDDEAAEGPGGKRLLTPGYAAPEQLGGVITKATDVYALGRLLHELLLGRRPAWPPGEWTPEPEVWRPLRRGAGGAAGPLAGSLGRICRIALREVPGRRYATARALAADVHRYLLGLPLRPGRLRRHGGALTAGGGYAAGGRYAVRVGRAERVRARRVKRAHARGRPRPADAG